MLKPSELAARVEGHGFECQGGRLEECRDWRELKALFVPEDPKSDMAADAWLETYTGRQFYFLDPKPEMVCIEDIAHQLAGIPRFLHATRHTYSVAEHSILLADYLARRWPSVDGTTVLTALLHDASEYITGDLAHPFKVWLKSACPAFKQLELGLEAAIAARFGTIHPLPSLIKELDARITQDERYHGMTPNGNKWGTDHIEPLGVRLNFWPAAVAEEEFHRAFQVYSGLAARG